jgi:AraC-like DNA-binding protein
MKPGAGSTFLEDLKKEIDDNLTNDQFSVEELAKNIGMSRSQLHRKLSTATGQSVSQFIREYRLQLGMELLKGGELTAAEVADKVGFGSPTYFSKCFNEYYGFPPGEVKNRLAVNPKQLEPLPVALTSPAKEKHTRLFVKIAATVALLIVVGVLSLNYSGRKKPPANPSDKSIAILPLRNLREDPRNEYIS